MLQSRSAAMIVGFGGVRCWNSFCFRNTVVAL